MGREPGGEIKRGYIITINIIIFHNYDIMFCIMLFHNYDIMFYDYVSYLHPPLRSATSLREHVTSGRGFPSLRGKHVRNA